jgi:hypothetical protein
LSGPPKKLKQGVQRVRPGRQDRRHDRHRGEPGRDRAPAEGADRRQHERRRRELARQRRQVRGGADDARPPGHRDGDDVERGEPVDPARREPHRPAGRREAGDELRRGEPDRAEPDRCRERHAPRAAGTARRDERPERDQPEVQRELRIARIDLHRQCRRRDERIGAPRYAGETDGRAQEPRPARDGPVPVHPAPADVDERRVERDERRGGHRDAGLHAEAAHQPDDARDEQRQVQARGHVDRARVRGVGQQVSDVVQRMHRAEHGVAEQRGAAPAAGRPHRHVAGAQLAEDVREERMMQRLVVAPERERLGARQHPRDRRADPAERHQPRRRPRAARGRCVPRGDGRVGRGRRTHGRRWLSVGPRARQRWRASPSFPMLRA